MDMIPFYLNSIDKPEVDNIDRDLRVVDGFENFDDFVFADDGTLPLL